MENPEHLSHESLFFLACSFVILFFGVILLLVARGDFPGYQDGIYGILLVLCGLYLLITGRKPGYSGERSLPRLATGILFLVTGYVTCIIPKIPGIISPILVAGFFGTGAILLFKKSGLKKSVVPGKNPGNRGLNGELVYPVIAVLLFLVTVSMILDILSQEGFATWLLAFVSLVLGIAGILSVFMPGMAGLSPPSAIPAISPDMVMGVAYSLYMLVLGCLLVPVYLGLLPFALGSQLGSYLLLVGIEATLVGNILTFRFGRSRKTLLAGVLLSAAGTCAIMIPSLPSQIFGLIVGLLNLCGGFFLLCFLWAAKRKSYRTESALDDEDRRILKRLFLLLLLTAILMIYIGLFMLIHNLVPGIIFAVSLAGFGLVLFALCYVLSVASARHLLAPDPAD